MPSRPTSMRRICERAHPGCHHGVSEREHPTGRRCPMLRQLERLGGQVLGRVLPTEKAAAACTITTRWTYCGYCIWDASWGCYRPAYRHEERLNDCRWYTDQACGSWVGNWCC